MNRLLPIIALLFFFSSSYGQQNILLLKKGNQVMDRFPEGFIMAFQLKTGQWQKGEIIKITKDSIYIRPMVPRYTMFGIDTVHFPVMGVSFADIYAIPKKGLDIGYTNGHYDIVRSAGHVHWYWIKSGFIFRLGAAAYAALNITNGLIQNDLSLKKEITPLGVAALVFIGGTILHKTYKVFYPLGKKYYLETLLLR